MLDAGWKILVASEQGARSKLFLELLLASSCGARLFGIIASVLELVAQRSMQMKET